MNSCLLFFILCFYFTHSIILIHFHESPFFLYFSLFYFPLFTHLFTTRHFTFASASRLRACPDYSVGICFRMPRLVCIRNSHAFASAILTRLHPRFSRVCIRDSHAFASAILTRLHPLGAGLSKTFPRIVGGVETRAAYDLIGKSWPGARYMRGEPRNTVSLSSVLDHH